MKSSNDNFEQQDLVEIGKVTGAHGVRGAVRVYSYAESPDCFASGNVVVLILKNDTVRRHHRIVHASPYKSVVRLTLEGVTTRDQAEALTGSAVYMFKEDLPPLEDDVFYWADLLGMDVYTETDIHLGRIKEIIQTGANDVYVIEPLADRKAKEILIPAIASVVLSIEVENKRMRVALPDGLTDL